MLTSRERCIRSILNEEPDRIPLGLNIRPEPYERLKEALGIREHFRLIKQLGIDIVDVSIGIKGGYLPNDIEIKEGPYAPAYRVGEYRGFEIRRDLWGIESLWAPDHTYTYTYYRHPLQHIPLEEYIWPEVDESGVRDVEKMRELYSDYAIFGGVNHLWEIVWQLTGFSEIMRMLFSDPTKADKIFDRVDRIRLEQAKLLCEAGVDVVCDGDDVGMQKGMMINPTTWRRFLKPKYTELIKLCHRYGVFFHFHSDGWIEPIIPDLIEIGVDILNPIQPECMDPEKLKILYGDKLCFNGTIGVQSTLPFGTPEDVSKEVIDRIAKLGPTGLILAPTHAMQPDVSVENILALYRTALKYGWNTRKITAENIKRVI
ncbi:MAG: uroporphyrinogen decarboxylase family protein [Thermoproteota archaeon]